MQSMSQEHDKLKLKIAQQNTGRNFREDYEKAQKQIKKLLNRLTELEKDEEQRNQYLEIQKQIEDTMRKEDQQKESKHKVDVTIQEQVIEEASDMDFEEQTVGAGD